MLLINAIVILIVFAAPMTAIYFRRSSAVASIAALILAFTTCDNMACSAALFSLLFVIFILSVEVAEPEATESGDQHVTPDGNGHSDATTAKGETL